MTPDAYTIKEHLIPVGNGHTLYVHDWGNQRAKLPIVRLHGGPGAGSKDANKLLFDPTKQRVIFYDQRGAGRSTPYGELAHNTTADLVNDLEKIARKLRLKRFILTGSSWGSTLALAYALTFPKRVHTLIVQGVFTGSAKEIAYLDKGLFRTHFPDAWQRFLDATPKKHHDDPAAYHFARILGDDQTAAKQSGWAYLNLEGSICQIDDRFVPSAFDAETFDEVPIRTEVRYMLNGCFMPDRTILDNAHKLTMPVWIIQGRYDFIGPPMTAYELHQKVPNSNMIWTEAGHSRNDRGNADVLKTLLLHLSQAA